MTEKPLIAITMGDPCGVGPEIVVTALANPAVTSSCIPFVIGDATALLRALHVCSSTLTLQEITAPEEAGAVPAGSIALLSSSRLTLDEIQFGKPGAAAGDAVHGYISSAARFCLDRRIAAMVTAPMTNPA